MTKTQHALTADDVTPEQVCWYSHAWEGLRCPLVGFDDEGRRTLLSRFFTLDPGGTPAIWPYRRIDSALTALAFGAKPRRQRFVDDCTCWLSVMLTLAPRN